MLREDLLGFYNGLIQARLDIPIGVMYSRANRCLVFTQYSWRMDVGVLNYYCEDLRKIKRTILLPEDTKDLLDSIKALIDSNQLNKDRLLISPIKYGLEIYRANPNNMNLGPLKLATLRFVSSNGWLFRKIVNIKYSEIIGNIEK